MSEFFWSYDEEPHLKRRKEILKEHPEVRDLYGVNKSLKFKIIALVIIQVVSAPFVAQLHWALYLLIAYFVGATINHSLFLGIHELSHNLAFKSKTANNWLSMFANIPIVFPYAMSFKKYHLMHHWDQGNEHNDTDLPSIFEAKIFQGLFGKLTWVTVQILMYALRPMIVKPIKIDKWQAINIVFQLTAMILYAVFVGYQSVLYLFVCGLLAGSLHPMAGHFIAEHYVFEEGQETYSYYGPLNRLAFNVGYHNEHHDFPNIPGARLPELKKLAPEYYDELHSHKSWVKVLYDFITAKDITLYNRVKREGKKEREESKNLEKQEF